MPLDPELMKILACPACKKPLVEEGNALFCGNCRKDYPIEDGIPVLLIEKAKPRA